MGFPPRIGSEDRRTGKAKQVKVFKCLRDPPVHIPELRTMAFVKDQYDVVVINGMVSVSVNEHVQLLDGRDKM